ncbi:hypothetical protein GOV12_01645 [Candidatus Pacearchaeota archaeon]|nr:hypothetical protein [Candidatus Pacearchaeota archaeon]
MNSDCNDYAEKINVPYIIFRMDNGRFRHMLEPTIEGFDAVHSKKFVRELSYEVVCEGFINDVSGLDEVLKQVDRLNDGVLEQEPKIRFTDELVSIR